MAMKGQSFNGANVFMSRNLVSPEIFDALHDALKLNGAQVFLCCDPSRNGPNDFHVISSPDHEKFQDLKAKGCNMLGPQCVLSCAKENRALPRRGYTCCLAMDGVKVLVSGFDMHEKAEMLKMVGAMSGALLTKATLDVSFVIVKNVLAAKYKWALNTLKKPIVTVDWLHQCWNEHRVVPQESHRVSPFSGLMICVTRIPPVERKEMEKIIIQNGGKYSAELTKKCTHLICDAPEGDKYKVARRWGHIHVVARKWFDQSITRRACLNEDSYPVTVFSPTSIKTASDCLMPQSSQENKIGNSQRVLSSFATDSDVPDVPFTWSAYTDLEPTISQGKTCLFSEASISRIDEESEACSEQCRNETKFDTSVANDSLSDESDLYLSECRILLVGLEASEMRKMVSLVRRGGGSRYMSFNDKLTHIVVGSPSDTEKKEIRSLAALGVISVVKTTWLQDCDREKKELPIFKRHIAYDVLVSKDSAYSSKTAVGMNSTVGKKCTVRVNMPSNMQVENVSSGVGTDLELPRCAKCPKNVNEDSSFNTSSELPQDPWFSSKNSTSGDVKLQLGIQDGKLSDVFKGKTICFSSSFPEDRRAEIIQWVNQGGGVVGDNVRQNVHFTIECHGVVPRPSDIYRTTFVSSHWIRSCLEVGRLLDVSSHIIYSPLPCQIPLPGFENFRFSVSQYEDQERLLLRNLSFVVGAKFVERLTKKVTHLLCKFKIGPKFEAACKWGIHSVTSEWIYECIKHNKVVPVDSFGPKEVSAQDQEAGLYAGSQFPTQAFQMISRDNPSQKSSQSQETQRTSAKAAGSKNVNVKGKVKRPISSAKRARLLQDVDEMPCGEHLAPYCRPKFPVQAMPTDVQEIPRLVPDVADVIEDLLEQTSKIHDVESPDKTNDKSLFPSDSSVIPQNHPESVSAIGLSKTWSNRTVKQDEDGNSSQDVCRGVYDGFSETQTESQVVGYEEDLSGRQMLIDRVRTRSSLS